MRSNVTKVIRGLALATATVAVVPPSHAYSLCVESALTIHQPTIFISVGDQPFAVSAGYMGRRRDCVNNMTASGEVAVGWSERGKVACNAPPIPPGNTRDLTFTFHLDPGVGGLVPNCQPK